MRTMSSTINLSTELAQIEGIVLTERAFDSLHKEWSQYITEFDEECFSKGFRFAEIIMSYCSTMTPLQLEITKDILALRQKTSKFFTAYDWSRSMSRYFEIIDSCPDCQHENGDPCPVHG